MSAWLDGFSFIVFIEDQHARVLIEDLLDQALNGGRLLTFLFKPVRISMSKMSKLLQSTSIASVRRTSKQKKNSGPKAPIYSLNPSSARLTANIRISTNEKGWDFLKRL